MVDMKNNRQHSRWKGKTLHDENIVFCGNELIFYKAYTSGYLKIDKTIIFQSI